MQGGGGFLQPSTAGGGKTPQCAGILPCVRSVKRLTLRFCALGPGPRERSLESSSGIAVTQAAQLQSAILWRYL